MTGGRADARATTVGAIAILLWSCLALLTAAAGRCPPFELSALTFAVGGGTGLAWTAARGRLALLRQPPTAWLVGVGGLFGYHALYFAALRLAPPAQASLVAYLWPLLIVLLSALLPGEALAGRRVAGAVMGFSGVFVLLGNGGLAVDPDHLAGVGLAFACALVWSGYSVLSRRLAAVPTDAVAGFCLATAALAGLCHVLFETAGPPLKLSEWAAVLALGLGPVGLAFYVWDHGVKHGDIRLLGVAAYAAPVLSTAILVAAGYAEAGWRLFAACGLIVAGAVIAGLRPRSPARAIVRPRHPSA